MKTFDSAAVPSPYSSECITNPQILRFLFHGASFLPGDCSPGARCYQLMVNRRLVVVLVYRAASSGMAFFRAVVSTRLLLTAL